MNKEGVPKEVSQPHTNENLVVENNEGQETQKFRGRVLRAMFLGAGALLSACGEISKEEIPTMPLSNIDAVIKSPDQFAELPMVKVDGYPVRIGEKNMLFPYPVFDGDFNIKRFDWHERQVVSYKILAGSDLNGPALEAYADGDSTFIIKGMPLTFRADKMEPQEHSVVGKLRKEGRGENARYVLEIKNWLVKE